MALLLVPRKMRESKQRELLYLFSNSLTRVFGQCILGKNGDPGWSELPLSLSSTASDV